MGEMNGRSIKLATYGISRRGKTARMGCGAVDDHARQLMAAGGGISLKHGLIGAIPPRSRQVSDKVV